MRNETAEKLEMLEEAMALVMEAQQLVDDVVSDLTRTKAHYRAYGRYGFDQLLGNGNPYDHGLQNLMEELEENEE